MSRPPGSNKGKRYTRRELEVARRIMAREGAAVLYDGTPPTSPEAAADLSTGSLKARAQKPDRVGGALRAGKVRSTADLLDRSRVHPRDARGPVRATQSFSFDSVVEGSRPVVRPALAALLPRPTEEVLLPPSFPPADSKPLVKARVDGLAPAYRSPPRPQVAPRKGVSKPPPPSTPKPISLKTAATGKASADVPKRDVVAAGSVMPVPPPPPPPQADEAITRIRSGLEDMLRASSFKVVGSPQADHSSARTTAIADAKEGARLKSKKSLAQQLLEGEELDIGKIMASARLTIGKSKKDAQRKSARSILTICEMILAENDILKFADEEEEYIKDVLLPKLNEVILNRVSSKALVDRANLWDERKKEFPDHSIESRNCEIIARAFRAAQIERRLREEGVKGRSLKSGGIPRDAAATAAALEEAVAAAGEVEEAMDGGLTDGGKVRSHLRVPLSVVVPTEEGLGDGEEELDEEDREAANTSVVGQGLSMSQLVGVTPPVVSRRKRREVTWSPDVAKRGQGTAGSGSAKSPGLLASASFAGLSASGSFYGDTRALRAGAREMVKRKIEVASNLAREAADRFVIGSGLYKFTASVLDSSARGLKTIEKLQHAVGEGFTEAGEISRPNRPTVAIKELAQDVLEFARNRTAILALDVKHPSPPAHYYGSRRPTPPSTPRNSPSKQVAGIRSKLLGRTFSVSRLHSASFGGGLSFEQAAIDSLDRFHQAILEVFLQRGIKAWFDIETSVPERPHLFETHDFARVGASSVRMLRSGGAFLGLAQDVHEIAIRGINNIFPHLLSKSSQMLRIAGGNARELELEVLRSLVASLPAEIDEEYFKDAERRDSLSISRSVRDTLSQIEALSQRLGISPVGIFHINAFEAEQETTREEIRKREAELRSLSGERELRHSGGLIGLESDLASLDFHIADNNSFFASQSSKQFAQIRDINKPRYLKRLAEEIVRRREELGDLLELDDKSPAAAKDHLTTKRSEEIRQQLDETLRAEEGLREELRSEMASRDSLRQERRKEMTVPDGVISKRSQELAKSLQEVAKNIEVIELQLRRENLKLKRLKPLSKKLDKLENLEQEFLDAVAPEDVHDFAEADLDFGGVVARRGESSKSLEVELRKTIEFDDGLAGGARAASAVGAGGTRDDTELSLRELREIVYDSNDRQAEDLRDARLYCRQMLSPIQKLRVNIERIDELLSNLDGRLVSINPEEEGIGAEEKRRREEELEQYNELKAALEVRKESIGTLLDSFNTRRTDILRAIGLEEELEEELEEAAADSPRSASLSPAAAAATETLTGSRPSASTPPSPLPDEEDHKADTSFSGSRSGWPSAKEEGVDGRLAQTLAMSRSGIPLDESLIGDVSLGWQPSLGDGEVGEREGLDGRKASLEEASGDFASAARDGASSREGIKEGAEGDAVSEGEEHDGTKHHLSEGEEDMSSKTDGRAAAVPNIPLDASVILVGEGHPSEDEHGAFHRGQITSATALRRMLVEAESRAEVAEREKFAAESEAADAESRVTLAESAKGRAEARAESTKALVLRLLGRENSELLGRVFGSWKGATKDSKIERLTAQARELESLKEELARREKEDDSRLSESGDKDAGNKTTVNVDRLVHAVRGRMLLSKVFQGLVRNHRESSSWHRGLFIANSFSSRDPSSDNSLRFFRIVQPVLSGKGDYDRVSTTSADGRSASDIVVIEDVYRPVESDLSVLRRNIRFALAAILNDSVRDAIEQVKEEAEAAVEELSLNRAGVIAALEARRVDESVELSDNMLGCLEIIDEGFPELCKRCGIFNGNISEGLTLDIVPIGSISRSMSERLSSKIVADLTARVETLRRGESIDSALDLATEALLDRSTLPSRSPGDADLGSARGVAGSGGDLPPSPPSPDEADHGAAAIAEDGSISGIEFPPDDEFQARVIEDRRFYESGDVNYALARALLRSNTDGTKVVDSTVRLTTDFSDERFQEGLREALTKFRDEGLSEEEVAVAVADEAAVAESTVHNSLVLPIHDGRDHFMGLHIRRVKRGDGQIFEITYIDPAVIDVGSAETRETLEAEGFGIVDVEGERAILHPLPEHISNILKAVFPTATMTQSVSTIQHCDMIKGGVSVEGGSIVMAENQISINNYHCGPIVVAALDEMVRGRVRVSRSTGAGTLADPAFGLLEIESARSTGAVDAESWIPLDRLTDRGSNLLGHRIRESHLGFVEHGTPSSHHAEIFDTFIAEIAVVRADEAEAEAARSSRVREASGGGASSQAAASPSPAPAPAGDASQLAAKGQQRQ